MRTAGQKRMRLADAASVTYHSPMKSSYHLVTIRGIPIYIHISLPILLGFYFLRNLMADGGGFVHAIFALQVGILIFASVALHELGHSFMAMHFGHRVKDIVLMIIGGMARMVTIPKKPYQEVLVALAGPAVSLALSALIIPAIALIDGRPLMSLRLPDDWLCLTLLSVGATNLFLALFNLLPSFPMDGGRVFRAAMTRKLGRLKATELAMRTGQVICVLFILSGIFGLEGVPLFREPSFLRVLIGFFIFNAARAEYQMVLREEMLRQGGFQNPLEVIFGGRQGPPPPPYGGDDAVEVGPPPYERRGGSRSHVERD